MEDIARGQFVFTSDGAEIGTVADVNPTSLTIELRGRSQQTTIPVDMVQGVSAGRLELLIDEGEFRARFGAMPGNGRGVRGAESQTVAEHVPMDDLQQVWRALGEPSWSGLETAAYAVEDGREGGSVPRNVVSDITGACAALGSEGQAFPRTIDEAYTLINRTAERLPHETLHRTQRAG